MTISYLKGRLLLVSLLNLEPIIGVIKVKFSEDLNLRKTVKYLAYERDRILVLNSNLIKFAVVYAEPYYTISLRNE